MFVWSKAGFHDSLSLEEPSNKIAEGVRNLEIQKLVQSFQLQVGLPFVHFLVELKDVSKILLGKGHPDRAVSIVECDWKK